MGLSILVLQWCLCIPLHCIKQRACSRGLCLSWIRCHQGVLEWHGVLNHRTSRTLSLRVGKCKRWCDSRLFWQLIWLEQLPCECLPTLQGRLEHRSLQELHERRIRFYDSHSVFRRIQGSLCTILNHTPARLASRCHRSVLWTKILLQRTVGTRVGCPFSYIAWMHGILLRMNLVGWLLELIERLLLVQLRWICWRTSFQWSCWGRNQWISQWSTEVVSQAYFQFVCRQSLTKARHNLHLLYTLRESSFSIGTPCWCIVGNNQGWPEFEGLWWIRCWRYIILLWGV